MWEWINKYSSFFFVLALGAFVVWDLISYFRGLVICFDFLAFCNDNQGFVSAILALCSVWVAIIALFISIRTSRKQNKIQIDLQARQLKLDTFQLRYECWESFE
ncbi:hypothetical protein, partial [Helicobacter ganmani]|uniref:hypothetical protein n=1 Tax=Helicobacter ganmani TaxID=60246 RepID=UPI003A8BE9E9